MTIPSATLSRLVTYLRLLETLELAGTQQVSSGELAAQAQVTAFQVRKDLAHVGPVGTRGRGYSVALLKRKIIRVLGLDRPWQIIIVGMGRLGQAIAHFPIAAEYSFEYVGLFDPAPQPAGQIVGGLPVRPLAQLPEFMTQQHVDMAFLSVPIESAQQTAETLVQAGIRSILNFSPAILGAAQPEDDKEISKSEKWQNVTVENVDFLAGLQRLAYYTQQSSPPEAEEI
ncbi:redox-sensing transcriptional repressor Rex [Deinococcus sp. Marseille-Q6407]|uniref:redox-sensing transcriptional repressor Rex n=1 Tax=Deinococcus sp. Marseille-Q6407 TaxID=2969223 RepID=UPI0021C20227|nr:redox-sensing transcriptional repressor Rex [Deinococcus sp. Marseille-Q6407]